MNTIIKLIALGAGLAASCISTACSEEGPAPKDNPREEIAMSRAEEEIVDATNVFAARLMNHLSDLTVQGSEDAMPDNFVVSPLSLSMALGMTANAAEGTTRREILDVLGLGEADIEAANSLNSKLAEKLPGLDSQTKVSFANALWVDSQVSDMLRPEFATLLSDVYKAPSASVTNLGWKEGMDEINSWSANHTDNLIPELLSEPLGPNTLMALTNALYFKGQWTKKFDKSQTKRAEFYNLDGTYAKVDMMRKDNLSAQACEDEGYKAAALSYGNGAYALIVVVPEWGTHPAKVFEAIDPADLRKLATGDEFKTHINVKLPRFTVENGANMIPALEAMGMVEAFTTRSDFSGMWATNPGDFALDKVLQRAKIVVDEEGAEAAASTVISGGLTSPGPIMSKDFIVDRPFAFAIAERSTGVLLFAGAVTKM